MTVECLFNDTTPVKVPCNGTDETILCNGTATRYLVECRTVSGPTCAEYNGTNFIAADLDTVVSSNDANITCRMSLKPSTMSRDFKSVSNVAVEHYISIILLTKKPGKLLQQPLLLWTFGVITALFIMMVAIGTHLDRSDRRHLSSRVRPRSIIGVVGKRHQLTLALIAKASYPKFLIEMRETPVFSHALTLIWRWHSVLNIFSEYIPSKPRIDRAFLVYIKCLWIMLSQILALWLAHNSSDYCESATRKNDCEKRGSLYYRCSWKLNRAKDEPKCQLKIPSTQKMGTELLLLVFVLFAISLPICSLIEICYLKYACAPAELPMWAHANPTTIKFLRCIFTFTDSRLHMPLDDDSYTETTRAEDDDESEDDIYGGAPIRAEITDDDDEHSEESRITLEHSIDIYHRVGLRLWSNLCIDEPPAEHVLLNVLDFYALRAVNPVMKTLYLIRAELVAIADTSVKDETQKAIDFLIRELDFKWGCIADFECAADSKKCLNFAKSVHSQLVSNLETAAQWDQCIEKFGMEDPLEACALVVNLVRRQHLNFQERRILDSELKDEGAFSSKVAKCKVNMTESISLRTKILGQLICLFALVFPIWFMFLVATKLDQSGHSGKRSKRLIFIKTIVLTIFTFVVIEPWVIIIMKQAVPGSLYQKLCHFEDPMICVIPYETIRLFVEPSTLLSPIAALTFAQVCDRIPMRLGPESVSYALHVFAERRRKGTEFTDEDEYKQYLADAVANEFDDVQKIRKRQSLNSRSQDIKEAILHEASMEYAQFARTYPKGSEQDKENKKNWASEVATDFHHTLNFVRSKKQTILCFMLSLFFLLAPGRSIVAQELIVFISFSLEICQPLENIRNQFQFADLIVQGGSELLFLHLLMAGSLILILLLATLITQSAKLRIEHDAQLRHVIRQRLQISFADENSAKVKPEDAPEFPENDVGDRASFDSLDGFFVAGSDSVAAARAIRRGSRRDTFSLPTLDEVFDDKKDAPFEPESLASFDPDKCPISASVYLEDVTSDNEDDVSTSTERSEPDAFHHDQDRSHDQYHTTHIQEKEDSFSREWI